MTCNNMPVRCLMADEKDFIWVAYYRELAKKLLDYKENRSELVQKIQDTFTRINLPLPTLDRDENNNKRFIDVDPFTVFGLFNKNGQTKNTRYKIMSGMAESFSLESEIPDDVFFCPTLMPLNATYYRFHGRDEDDIDKLWNLFSAAMKYVDIKNDEIKEQFMEWFDKSIALKYIGNSKMTIGLFWIAPDTFMALDSRTLWYIYETDRFPEEFKSTLPKIENPILAVDYLNLCGIVSDYCASPDSSHKDFKEISQNAYLYSEEVNQQIKDEKEKERYDAEGWYPDEKFYHPGLSADDWEQLLNDPSVFDDQRLTIMKRWLEIGGEASCKAVSDKYGKTPAFYNMSSIQLASSVIKASGCPEPPSLPASKKWPVLYKGKTIDSFYVWKLRPELAEALSRIDLTKYPLIEPQKGSGPDKPGKGLPDNEDGVRYWIFAPGKQGNMWDEFYKSGIMAIHYYDIGDLRQYKDREEIRTAFQKAAQDDASHNNDVLAAWQFTNELKPGDIVFAKRGTSKLLGRGVVQSDYEYDPDAKNGFCHIRKVNWTNNEEKDHPGKAVTKTLTDITTFAGYIEQLNALYEIDETSEDEDQPEKIYEKYDKNDFLREVYLDESEYEKLVGMLEQKKNLILQGPPGVGKTFAAKRLAYSIIGEKNDDRVEMIQFHQSYSYEYFIQGYRPSGAQGEFELVNGVFYQFCKEKANNDPDHKYFFIIDEINRGNLSKIFGELFVMLEADKRGKEIRLLYGDAGNERFSIPKNVYLIGMMNTADRSLAMMDYALRRRFCFYTMKPGFDTAGFSAYQENQSDKRFQQVIDVIRELNSEIKTDPNLGQGFCIGHSYFINNESIFSEEELKRAVLYEIIPMLEEYWFDDTDNFDKWKKRLEDAIREPSDS